MHVAAEHLGRFDDGLAFVEQLCAMPLNDPTTAEGKALSRALAVLHICAGREKEAWRLVGSAATDRARVLAVAASAFAGRERIGEATAAFERALALVDQPSRDDPATRALAVTGNNLACALETRPTLSDAERALMLLAARTARRYWEIAGGFLEIERAEYRLAMSHLKAGNTSKALEHARECLRIVDANHLEAGERFFAHEALARALHAADPLLDRAQEARAERNRAAEQLETIEDASFRKFCAGELAKLDALLG